MTDFDIIFCADGILRASYGPKKPLLPLAVIYEEEGKTYKEKTDKTLTEFKFWSHWWDGATYFEKGLTLGMFLNCLEPWAEFFEDLTGKDVKAYIKECKKPHLVKDDLDKAYIALFYETQVSEISESIRDMPHASIQEWLESSHETRFTGEWRLDSKYTVSLYYQNEAEHYALSSNPLNTYQNVPIFLDDKHYVYAMDFKLKEKLGDNHGFLSPEVFGLQTATDENQEHSINFIQGPKDHTLIEVVKGFFQFFPYSPVVRERQNQEIKDSLLESNAELTEDELEAALDDIEQEVMEDREIKFARGRFNNVVNIWEENSHYWDNLVEKMRASPDVILKIGGFETDRRPDVRIFGYIVNMKDYKKQLENV